MCHSFLPISAGIGTLISAAAPRQLVHSTSAEKNHEISQIARFLIQNASTACQGNVESAIAKVQFVAWLAKQTYIKHMYLRRDDALNFSRTRNMLHTSYHERHEQH